MSTTTDRSKRVQVRVSESVFNRLQAVSESLGMPHSTVSSIAISEYILRKEREGALLENVNGALSGQLSEYFEQIKKDLAE